MARPKKDPSNKALADEIGEELRQRLVALAIERGYNPTSLAKATKVNRTLLSRIFGGHRAPTLDVVVLVAPALGVTPTEIMGYAVDKASGSRGTSDSLTTLSPGERRPPGLANWLKQRLGLTDQELWGLEHYRARQGDRKKDMEDPGFWDRELEFVRQLAAQQASSSSRAQGERAPGTSGTSARKPGH